jgi:hypothetical protein
MHVDAAFERNRDPGFGAVIAGEYRQLFLRIVNAAACLLGRHQRGVDPPGSDCRASDRAPSGRNSRIVTGRPSAQCAGQVELSVVKGIAHERSRVGENTATCSRAAPCNPRIRSL